MASHEASSRYVFFDYILYDNNSNRRTSIQDQKPLSVHKRLADDSTLSAIRTTARDNQPVIWSPFPFRCVTRSEEDGVKAEWHLLVNSCENEVPWLTRAQRALILGS